MTKAERDQHICYLYSDGGLTLGEIAGRFSLTRERVRQILEKHKIARIRRLAPMGNRRALLSVGVPKSVKDALRREADKRGTTMSELTVRALRVRVS